MHHVRCMAAMNPILNYVEFRTNHEPYMVHGVVHLSGALNYVEFRAAMYPILNHIGSGLIMNLTWFMAWYITNGALNHVRFRAAMHPTWCMAEREGFEPSIPLLAEYSLSRRAPSASRASLRFFTLCA
jgi:hypothetical protein